MAPLTLLLGDALPSEDNLFAGFCKGAWKLQTGAKKAMRMEHRPVGMYGHVSYWRCSKCNFEGPANREPRAKRSGSLSSEPLTSLPPLPGKSNDKSSSSTPSFDLRIRYHASTGIRYRWSFLAKSHVNMRTLPKSTDGSEGIFMCIFCCAEKRTSTPVFGNVDLFMEHLQVHGGRPGSDGSSPAKIPDQDLLNRTKCVVGRLADQSEEFELNIPPIMLEVAA
jgi:hypothetical protein